MTAWTSGGEQVGSVCETSWPRPPGPLGPPWALPWGPLGASGPPAPGAALCAPGPGLL